MVFAPGQIISYPEMCAEEGAVLQRGMNLRLHHKHSVLLMSRRQGAPYADHVEDDGRALIYEGHDEFQQRGGPDPKSLDQPEYTRTGRPTQNRRFAEAAAKYQAGNTPPELVRVYEKLRQGIWVYNGLFHLMDSRREQAGGRAVFKFRLQIAPEQPDNANTPNLGKAELQHTRLIPTAVKLEVWKRDGGRCVMCAKSDNLHFDHILPYAKGGSSLLASNIQLLCARHNLQKRDRIE